jgi:hypothetical protein
MRKTLSNLATAWSLVLITLLAAGLARAQDAPPEENKPLPLPEKVDYAATMRPPPGIVTEEPYVSWTKHRGKIEEGIARIEARFPDGRVRATTGLSVRCDGLILAPVWVREAIKEKAVVTVAPGEVENEVPKVPLPIAGRFYHNIPRVEYTILKVNGHHIPCVPLLESKNVEKGTRVRLYRAVPGEGGTCGVTWTPAKIGGAVENPEAGRYDRYSLVPADRPLAKDDAPEGALVVDEATGGVLGVVLDVPGAGVVFTTFIYFYDFTGEIGLLPTRAALKEHTGQSQHMSVAQINGLMPGKPSRGWQWVPGGAVRLTGFTLDHYRRNFRADTVCLPGFFLMTRPVTRKQYIDWATALPNDQRPKGLDAPGDPNLYPNWPQSLSRIDAALRYAADQGGRLPTELEWRRASITRNWDWAYSRLELWDSTLRQMITFINHSVTNTSLFQLNNWFRDGLLSNVSFFGEPITHSAAAQKGLVGSNLDNRFSNEISWHPCDVDLRAGEDVSVFGISNVLMNNEEYVLSTPSILGVAHKPFAARIDPLISVVTINLRQRSDAVSAEGRSAVALAAKSLDVHRKYAEYLNGGAALNADPIEWYIALTAMRIPVKGGIPLLSWFDTTPLPKKDGIAEHTLQLQATWEPNIHPGFRLAR